MARLARIVIPGIPHHVTQRGNGRQQTFFNNGDYAAYLALMRLHAPDHGVAVWHWVLMPNHVHLILVPTAPDSLRAFMARVSRGYAGMIHAREKRSGHFWQGRFGCVAMDEAHLAAALVYVSLNPVRAGLVAAARDWRWSGIHALLDGQSDGVTDVAAGAAAISRAFDDGPCRLRCSRRLPAGALNGATALAKARDEIALRSEELRKAAPRSRLQQLRAPVDGTVQQVSIYTIGAVVKPADPIMVIVPSDGGLVMEAQLPGRDIGRVCEGQRVAIKLDAWPFTRYGTVPAHIVGLSRDAIQDEKRGLVYAARIAIDGDWAAAKRSPIRLSAGMSGTADVKTGSRAIIAFLLSPIQRRIGEAGRER